MHTNSKTLLLLLFLLFFCTTNALGGNYVGPNWTVCRTDTYTFSAWPGGTWTASATGFDSLGFQWAIVYCNDVERGRFYDPGDSTTCGRGEALKLTQNAFMGSGSCIRGSSTFNIEPPVVSAIHKTCNQDTTLHFNTTDFTNSYSDPNGNSLARVKFVTIPDHGTLKYEDIIVTPNSHCAIADVINITFVPEANWAGSTSFKWNGINGIVAATNPADVDITISPPATTCAAVDPTESTDGSVNYNVNGGDTTKTCIHDFTAPSNYSNTFQVTTVSVPASGSVANAYYSCNGSAHQTAASGHTYTCPAGQTMSIGLDGSAWSSTDTGSLQGAITHTPTPTTCAAVDPTESTDGSVNYNVNGAAATKNCSHEFTTVSGITFTPSTITVPSGKSAAAYYSCNGTQHRQPVSGLTVTYTCPVGHSMTIGLDGSDWGSTDIGKLQGTVKSPVPIISRPNSFKARGTLGVIGAAVLGVLLGY